VRLIDWAYQVAESKNTKKIIQTFWNGFGHSKKRTTILVVSDAYANFNRAGPSQEKVVFWIINRLGKTDGKNRPG